MVPQINSNKFKNLVTKIEKFLIRSQDVEKKNSSKDNITIILENYSATHSKFQKDININ